MATFDSKAYWEARLAANPGIRGVGFSALGEAYNRWLYRVRRRVFLREARTLPIDWAHASVLDVGSGTGFYIQLWEELGVGSVAGADLTALAVSRLRQQFPGRDFFELDIGTTSAVQGLGPFEIVSAFDVLFHIVDDEKYWAAISNIYSLLRPGGWFLFSDQVLDTSCKRMEHVVSRSRADLHEALSAAGFVDVRRRPVFILMNHPVNSRSGAQKFAWSALTYPVRKCRPLTEPLGWALGAALYPPEIFLTRVLRVGFSIEMFTCRKPAQLND